MDSYRRGDLTRAGALSERTARMAPMIAITSDTLPALKPSWEPPVVNT